MIGTFVVYDYKTKKNKPESLRLTKNQSFKYEQTTKNKIVNKNKININFHIYFNQVTIDTCPTAKEPMTIADVGVIKLTNPEAD